MNLAHIALATGAREENLDRIAFFTGHGPVSHRQFQHKVALFVYGLAERGIKPGDKVLLRFTNSVEFAAAFLSVVWLGAIPVLQNTRFGKTELDYIIDIARPRAILLAEDRVSTDSSAGVRPEIPRLVATPHGLLNRGRAPIAGDTCVPEHAPFEAEANDPAFIVFSSGTTGRPKGIVHAHRWLGALAASNRLRLPLQPDDVVLGTGEWSFISCLGHNVLFPLLNGYRGSVLVERARPDRILATVQRDKVTQLYSVATLLRRILGHAGIENEYDLRSLQGIHSGGEPLGKTTKRELEGRFHCPVWEHMGMSEAQLLLGHGPGTERREGTVGRDWGAQATILDENLQPVSPDTPGILAFSRDYPGFFLGYLNDEARTQKVFQGPWVVTSDRASRDEDGYITIIGRADDCFKSKGVLIAPRAIEDALIELDNVIQACVFPIPDDEIGHRIGAAVALKSGNEGDITAWVCDQLEGRIASFKKPDLVYALKELPTNVNGKLQRSEAMKTVLATIALTGATAGTDE